MEKRKSPKFDDFLSESKHFWNAIKKFERFHHFDLAELVPPLTRREYVDVYGEIARRQGLSEYEYDRIEPGNFRFWIAPRCARRQANVQAVDGIFKDVGFGAEGCPHPLDPPSDKLHYLTTKVRYLAARNDRLRREFAELKRAIKHQATRENMRDANGLRELRKRQKEVRKVSHQLAITTERRLPVMPHGYRNPTKAEQSASDAIAAQNADFDNALNNLEV